MTDLRESFTVLKQGVGTDSWSVERLRNEFSAVLDELKDAVASFEETLEEETTSEAELRHQFAQLLGIHETISRGLAELR